MIETTGVGHSHLNSVTDIVVGAFRFVVNESDKDKIGAVLLKLLAKIMWGKKNGKGQVQVRERGLIIRPQKINLDSYKADISALFSRLEKYSETT